MVAMRLMSYEEKLLELVETLNIVEHGKFELGSGLESNYYVDGRCFSLHPKSAKLIGKILAEYLLGNDAVGGPLTSALPIISAVVHELEIPGFYVRMESKDYGQQKQIEGWLSEGENVAIVDDTSSTGSSILHTIKIVESFGAKVRDVAVVFNRIDEGGQARIIEAGYSFYPIFNIQNGTVTLA